MKKQRVKILFDAVPIAKEQLTGIGKTTVGLVESLAKTFPDEIELVGHYFSFLGKNKGFTLPTAPNIRYRKTTLIPGKVFNLLRRMGLQVPFELLVKEKGDFHLFPSFLGWPSLFHAPSTAIFHDVTFITNPEYVSRRNCEDLVRFMPQVVERSSFVTTITNSSKQGIIDAYGTPEDKILVQYIPPVDTVKISDLDAMTRLKNLGVAGNFLLYFGTLEPRKNLVGLLLAYEKLPKNLQDEYALVVAGGKGWNDDEIITTIERLKNAGLRIIQTGYVSDEDRAALFMKSTLYIMPSHYEGFGMQLLEAMTYKTPMLVSDIPVLHEVAEDAAEYCATDEGSIQKAIEKILNDPEQRKKLISAGQKRLQIFSWATFANELFARIKEVTNESHRS